MKETFPLSLPLILEMEEPFRLSPEELDDYWANGWDRDAEYVFRQNITLLHDQVCSVVPLRVPLSKYKHSKSQRKVLKKCADFQVEIKPMELNPAKEQMYRKHRMRFREYVRSTLTDFFYRYTGKNNFPTWEINIFHEQRLIAASFLDVGDTSVYSIYGMFDPEYQEYSLGK